MTTAEQPSGPSHLFVLPRGEANGFRASVRSHVVDFIEPGSYAFAPTTDDLFVVSIAAALAHSAQTSFAPAASPST